MAMAMHSVNSYPSAPTKDGILPSLLILKYSRLRGPLDVSMSTISRSSLFALATARIAVERTLLCRSHLSEVGSNIVMMAYLSGVKLSERHFCMCEVQSRDSDFRVEYEQLIKCLPSWAKKNVRCRSRIRSRWRAARGASS